MVTQKVWDDLKSLKIQKIKRVEPEPESDGEKIVLLLKGYTPSLYSSLWVLFDEGQNV